jgi:hypothetical protein
MAAALKDTATRLQEVTAAWEKLRPTKEFYGLTVEEFRTAVKPLIDARAAVADLEVRMQAALHARQLALGKARELLVRVLNAVKGDPTEGEDGELYAAMGYMPQTQRRITLTTKPPPK